MKTHKTSLDFFLGAVGPDGFRGFFDSLSPQEHLQLYLIKSGPGCGKSTMMKAIVEKADGTVQRIHCSSDPQSLDGVILSRPWCAVLDATPPHAMEPTHPMLTEQIVSLYDSLDPKKLSAQRSQILRVSMHCSSLHRRAAVYIKSGAQLLDDCRRIHERSVNFPKARQYANRLAARYLPKREGEGTQHKRFLSAITPEGHVFFYSTVSAVAKTAVVLHDDLGGCSPFLLDLLRKAALERGYDVIACYCPVGKEKLEHLLIPELSLAFLTSNHWHSFSLPNQKNIHCSRFTNEELVKPYKQRLRFNRKAARALFAQASLAQKEAKQTHDKLEKAYQSAVDFRKVDAAAARLEHELGL